MKVHDVFGKTEQFRVAETFGGLAGNEAVAIRWARLWRGLHITLCSVFNQHLLKTSYVPGAMPALVIDE